LIQLQLAVNNVFTQLTFSQGQISNEQFVQPFKNLSNSTPGQHVRHIIDMFQCLEYGNTTGVVNYESRRRNKDIETNKTLASELLIKICKDLELSESFGMASATVKHKKSCAQ
jgi:hypothetical protein